MERIKEVNVKDGYTVELHFKDGFVGTVDMTPFLGRGFTKELLEKEKFKQVFVEPGGGIAWPNGYDFCPDYLRQLASGTVERETALENK